jgi:glycosyltransferase involved in cell wall biosynthesis
MIECVSPSASVSWYRYWHCRFLQRALGKELADSRETVVYAQCPVAARAALAARSGSHQRVVLAVHFQVSQADEWVHKGLIRRDGITFRNIREREQEVLAAVDGIVYVSKSARDDLLTWHDETGGRPWTIVPNFVAELDTTPPSILAADLVTVGGLEVTKNHRYLLDVLAAARDRGAVLTLDIFGKGPCRGELQRQVDRLHLRDQVRFRGFRSDVRHLLPGYSAYVHAAYSEVLPLAIIEALAAGLPIVAGAVGGIPELFDDGVEGRVWPLDDADKAARTVVDLLADDGARSRAAEAASERFHRQFDAGVVGPRLLACLTGAGSKDTATVVGGGAPILDPAW